MSPIRLL